MKSKRKLVQVKNPKTGWYTKIDKTNALILGTKRNGEPYVGIPIAKRKPAGTWHASKGGDAHGTIPKLPERLPSKKKMRTIKEPFGKPGSFTKAQAQKAVRKVMAAKKEKKLKDREFVVLKDIIIPKGTVLTRAASEVSRVEPHYEHFIGFVAAPDACGEFVIGECDMEEAPEYFVELKR